MTKTNWLRSLRASAPDAAARLGACAIVLGSVGLLATGCRAPFNDPDQTGLLVSPTPGDYEGPIDLAVRNRTGVPLSCVGFETDHCASLADFLTGLASLAEGETATADQVTCTYIDITCTEPGWTAEEPPLRAWGWAINPPVEEE